MYIKHKNIITNNITIININIAQSTDILVEENSLVINMPNDKDTLRLTLVDEETAKFAQEKLFITLGMKSPLSGVLDLTNIGVIEHNKNIGITLQDIADKFNIDIREMSIVAIPTTEKIITKEVNIEEGDE